MKIQIHNDLIFPNMKFDSDISAIKFLSEELLKKGYVKPSYFNALVEREKIFPTGLDFIEYGVAIPHADSEHVNESTLAVATLKEPVEFKNMEDENKIVKTSIICMIALKEKKDQATFLANLMGTFSDNEKISSILNGGKSEIEKIFNSLAL